MFNSKKHKTAKIMPQEKRLREDSLGPTNNPGDKITEKEVPHRKGDQSTITEGQIKDRKSEKESQIIEKILNKDNGKYTDYRKAEESLIVTPINKLVENIRQDRLEKDWKTSVESHWSQTYNEKEQFGSLPKWKKNAPQAHENETSKSNWDESHTESGSQKFASLDRAAEAIKSGESIKYDTIIVAILQQAKKDGRELSKEERKAISDLKISRTNFLINK